MRIILYLMHTYGRNSYLKSFWGILKNNSKFLKDLAKFFKNTCVKTFLQSNLLKNESLYT